MRRARGPGESHIHPDASQGPKQHHRTEICHRLWAPSTPTIDIHKHILPHCLSSFFSTPEKYNCLINGSNKSTINNANKIKISVRQRKHHKSHCTESLSAGADGKCSPWHLQKRPHVCDQHWQQNVSQSYYCSTLSLYVNELDN